MEENKRLARRRLLVLSGIVVLIVLGGKILLSRRSSGEKVVDVAARTLGIEVQAKAKTKVAIQAGHWKNTDLPEEFGDLWESGTGTFAAGINEWEVSLDISQKISTILEKDGYEVDILPATVPVGYHADAFISIHADGNDDTTVSGFKVAPSDFDETGKAVALGSAIETAYQETTGMEIDPNVTEDMTKYFAFNFIKFNHAIDKGTPGVLVETGFLSNAADRKIIVGKSDLSAQGVAQGIETFFKEQKPST